MLVVEIMLKKNHSFWDNNQFFFLILLKTQIKRVITSKEVYYKKKRSKLLASNCKEAFQTYWSFSRNNTKGEMKYKKRKRGILHRDHHHHLCPMNGVETCLSEEALRSDNVTNWKHKIEAFFFYCLEVKHHYYVF